MGCQPYGACPGKVPARLDPRLTLGPMVLPTSIGSARVHHLIVWRRTVAVLLLASYTITATGCTGWKNQGGDVAAVITPAPAPGPISLQRVERRSMERRTASRSTRTRPTPCDASGSRRHRAPSSCATRAWQTTRSTASKPEMGPRPPSHSVKSRKSRRTGSRRKYGAASGRSDGRVARSGGRRLCGDRL